MNTYVLKLFLAGDGPKSEYIVSELHAICKAAFGEAYHLEVVDVLKDPQRAEEDHVLATPTLVREHPLPRIYVIGDLNHREKVLNALNIKLKDSN